MSVREEDKRKNNCPSRGLGLAAAAIGVGVGAALYYFLSRKPENPDGAGSSSQGWRERPEPLLEDPRSKVAIYKEQTFRERAWSLEECSICFEVMLRDQELVKLPCTHNFHLACIGPWLEQQQTCPMCRKSAE